MLFYYGIPLKLFCSAFDLLRNPTITTSELKKVIPELTSIDPAILARVDIDGERLVSSCRSSPDCCAGRYSAHLRRQESDLRVFMEDESLVLDQEMDYHAIEGLSSEVRERLFVVRPSSIVRLFSCHQICPFNNSGSNQGCGKANGRDDTIQYCFPAEICEEDICFPWSGCGFRSVSPAMKRLLLRPLEWLTGRTTDPRL